MRQELHVSVPNNGIGSSSGENVSPGMNASPDKFGRGEGLLQCTTPQMGEQSVRR